VSEVIGRREVEQRLEALCIGGGPGLPKRSRDLQILLSSSTLWMEPGAVYTEREVNQGLSQFLETVCPSLRLDVVTLRRLLVDHLYMDRDDSGRHYTPGRGPVGWRFADDVADVDPAQVVEEAIRRRQTRKSERMLSGGVYPPNE
jgi:hypothetical protein